MSSLKTTFVALLHIHEANLKMIASPWLSEKIQFQNKIILFFPTTEYNDSLPPPPPPFHPVWLQSSGVLSDSPLGWILRASLESWVPNQAFQLSLFTVIRLIVWHLEEKAHVCLSFYGDRDSGCSVERNSLQRQRSLKLRYICDWEISLGWLEQMEDEAKIISEETSDSLCDISNTKGKRQMLPWTPILGVIWNVVASQ